MNIVTKIKDWFRTFGRKVNPFACRHCGWRYPNVSVLFHHCTEQNRIAYWRSMMSFRVDPDPDCPICHGGGYVNPDNPTEARKVEFFVPITSCTCRRKKVEDLTPPSRLEDPACGGMSLLCKTCWDRLSTPKRQYYYKEWFKRHELEDVKAVEQQRVNYYDLEEIMDAVAKEKIYLWD